MKKNDVIHKSSEYNLRVKVRSNHKTQFNSFYTNFINLKLCFEQILYTLLPVNIKNKKKGTWIFVACIPKSGSTYITKKLANITGFQFSSPISYYMDIEQNIDIRLTPRLWCKNIVCQMHTPGKLFNIEIMKKYQIKPVILIRDPRDVILSHRDAMFRELPISPFYRIEP